MILLVLFVGFSFDLWLHGPIKNPMKNIGLVASLIAAPFNSYEAYLVAQVIWLALFLVNEAFAYSTKKVLDVTSPEEEEDKKPEGFDPRGKQLLADSKVQLLKNLNDATNADGKPWKLHAENESLGIKVFSSDFVGQSIKRWKVQVLLKNTSVDTVLSQCFDFNNRCGDGVKPGWDVALKQGQIVKSYEDGAYTIAVISTFPAGGGAISSREFIDIRLRERGSGEGVPTDGVLVTMVSPDPNKHSFLELPPQTKSLVHASNFPGAGIRLTPQSNGDLLYESCSAANIGGWIPTSVINSATAGAMMESHTAMVEHLRKYNQKNQ